MSVYKYDEIIAWENNEKIICVDCYDENPEKFNDYMPITEINEDLLFICDECEKRIN